jgi:NADH dehydrogenase
MDAYEKAERTQDPEEKRRMLTFVVVGGGPTGVALAGLIGEISRYYQKYYRNIDTKLDRIIIVHAAGLFPGSLGSCETCSRKAWSAGLDMQSGKWYR